MPDYGSKYTEKRQRLLELRLKRVYTEAQKDLQGKLDSFVAKKERKQQEKLAQKKAGLITEQEYKDWLSGQVFMEKQWKAKVQQATDILYHSNEKAVSMVRDEQMNVFTENANYQAYQVEKTTGFQDGISFELYDMATVDRLINEKPELLPRSNLKERKDRAWNQGIIANTITQGIIQGETIPQIAKRIARDTVSRNTKAMIRYARTAITGAENAGRMETMRRAEDMGINVKKQWLATLDRRTRDSHRHLDGQIRKIDEPFESELGEIMYPGDPEAEPGDVYNCRCTLTYIYPDYPSPASERIAYDEWEDEEGSHRESFIMGQDTNYGDWLLEKKRRHGEEIAMPVQSGFDRTGTIRSIAGLIEKNAFEGDVPEDYKKAIIKSLENADEQMLQIVQKTMDKVSVYWTEENPAHNVSHYTEGSGQIQIITKDASGELRTVDDIVRTFWHEYGHFVDDANRSGSGYGYKSEYGDYFFHGIQAEIMRDDKWMYAAREDANKLLKFSGLDDRYECRFESGMYGASIFKKTGEWVDARNPNFETMNELEDGLTKWVNSFTKSISLEDYRKQYGYPERPNREEYIETYFTPKRNLYRKRELYKGASEAYNKAIQEYYEKVDAFESTHDMQKIYDAWRKIDDEANRRKEAVAPATDTFDGGVGGSFYAFILHGGHEPKYYAVNRMGAKEGIANVFSALMTQDQNVLEAMNGLCPNTFNLIKGVILK